MLVLRNYLNLKGTSDIASIRHLIVLILELLNCPRLAHKRFNYTIFIYIFDDFW